MGEDRRPQQPAPAAGKAEGENEVPATASGGATTRGTPQPPGEIGGPKGPEPTRYGDWEKGGRCTDF